MNAVDAAEPLRAGTSAVAMEAAVEGNSWEIRLPEDASLTQRIFYYTFMPTYVALFCGCLYAIEKKWNNFLYDLLCLYAFTFLLILAERVYPINAKYNPPFDRKNWWTGVKILGKDLIYDRIAKYVNVLSTGIFTFLLIKVLPYRAKIPFKLWPESWSLPAKVALGFLMMELLTYWLHRLQHRSDFLWRFHALHHAPRTLNAMRSGRMHPGDSIINGVDALWMGFVGVGEAEALWVAFLGAIFFAIGHANVLTNTPIVRFFLVEPEFHWSHHSRGDHTQFNYSESLPWLDRIFGTYRAPAGRAIELGLDDWNPQTFKEELLDPFRRRSVLQPIDELAPPASNEETVVALT